MLQIYFHVLFFFEDVFKKCLLVSFQVLFNATVEFNVLTLTFVAVLLCCHTKQNMEFAWKQVSCQWYVFSSLICRCTPVVILFCVMFPTAPNYVLTIMLNDIIRYSCGATVC